MTITADSHSHSEAFQKLPKGLTLDQIAEQLGVSYGYAAILTRNSGYKPKNKKQLFWENFFAEIENEPPFTRKEIAERTSTTLSTAGNRAKEFGYKVKISKKPRQEIYDWGSVDWNDHDCDIATQLGCSRQAVSLHRQIHNISKVPVKRHRGPRIAITIAISQLVKEFAEEASGILRMGDWVSIVLQEDDIDEVTRMSYIRRLVYETFSDYQKPVYSFRIPLDMDFRIANTDLAKIWGTQQTTVAWNRIKSGKMVSMYVGQQPCRLRDRRYLKLMAAEDKRADVYFDIASSDLKKKKAMLEKMSLRWEEIWQSAESVCPLADVSSGLGE